MSCRDSADFAVVLGDVSNSRVGSCAEEEGRKAGWRKTCNLFVEEDGFATTRLVRRQLPSTENHPSSDGRRSEKCGGHEHVPFVAYARDACCRTRSAALFSCSETELAIYLATELRLLYLRNDALIL